MEVKQEGKKEGRKEDQRTRRKRNSPNKDEAKLTAGRLAQLAANGLGADRVDASPTPTPLDADADMDAERSGLITVDMARFSRFGVLLKLKARFTAIRVLDASLWPPKRNTKKLDFMATSFRWCCNVDVTSNE